MVSGLARPSYKTGRSTGAVDLLRGMGVRGVESYAAGLVEGVFWEAFSMRAAFFDSHTTAAASKNPIKPKATSAMRAIIRMGIG